MKAYILKSGGGGGGPGSPGSPAYGIYLGGLGACCRTFLRLMCHRLLVQSEASSDAKLETIKWP